MNSIVARHCILLLRERYWDLVFVDDVKEFKCVRCARVAIDHQMTNCGHIICNRCSVLLGNTYNCRCHDCEQYITHTEGKDFHVQRRIHELQLHCPNYKHGCQLIMMLQDIPEHLTSCPYKTDQLIRLMESQPFTCNCQSVGQLTTELQGNIKQLDENLHQNGRKTTEMCQKMDKQIENIDQDNKCILEQITNMSSQIQDLRMMLSPRSCYGILLLGGKGSGKSTLINSFANYAQYKTMGETVRAHEFSAAEEVKKHKNINYRFNINQSIDIRWIDSPGLTGLKNENRYIIKNVFQNYINYVNTIAIVLNANNLENNCVQEVLLNLGNQSTRNIIIILTHCISPSSDIMESLQETMKQYSSQLIIDDKNVFCFDNKPLSELNQDESSWKISFDEYQRLINYIIRVPPYDVTESVDIVECREFAKSIGMIIGQISEAINENEERLGESMEVENLHRELQKEKSMMINAVDELYRFISNNALLPQLICHHKYTDSDKSRRSFANPISLADLQNTKRQLMLMDIYGHKIQSLCSLQSKITPIKDILVKNKYFSITDLTNS